MCPSRGFRGSHVHPCFYALPGVFIILKKKNCACFFIFPEIPRLIHPCYLGLMGAPAPMYTCKHVSIHIHVHLGTPVHTRAHPSTLCTPEYTHAHTHTPKHTLCHEALSNSETKNPNFWSYPAKVHYQSNLKLLSDIGNYWARLVNFISVRKKNL